MEQTWEKMVLEICSCLLGTVVAFHVSAHLLSLPVGRGSTKGIHVHPLDLDRRLLVQGCHCLVSCEMALQHVDFHASLVWTCPGQWKLIGVRLQIHSS